MMLEDDLGIVTPRHCLIREDLFPIKKETNVVSLERNELHKPIFDDYYETIINFEIEKAAQYVLKGNVS